MAGNLGQRASYHCYGGVVFTDNVWFTDWSGSTPAKCSTTDSALAGGSSAVGFVDLAGLDLHLTAGSPAIDAGSPSDFAAADIDGQTRPAGALPDAGADETV
jgi:hypothetical protein